MVKLTIKLEIQAIANETAHSMENPDGQKCGPHCMKKKNEVIKNN